MGRGSVDCVGRFTCGSGSSGWAAVTMLGPMPADENLYFAYGSNMGASAFRVRCPHAVQVGIARVEGYRIGFTGYSANRGGGVADLVEAASSVVWGALFDLTKDGFDRLDRYEGVASRAYARDIWKLTRDDGTPVSAWTYVVVNKKPEILPSHEYWELLVDGATEAGLPPGYVAHLEGLAHGS
jgi:cation transport regulator ChaC